MGWEDGVFAGILVEDFVAFNQIPTESSEAECCDLQFFQSFWVGEVPQFRYKFGGSSLYAFDFVDEVDMMG